MCGLDIPPIVVHKGENTDVTCTSVSANVALLDDCFEYVGYFHQPAQNVSYISCVK